jgi:hypothetical protein
MLNLKPVRMLLLLSSLLLLFSCRKSDDNTVSTTQETNIVEQKFFNQHLSVQPLVHELLTIMKRENAKINFVEKIVNNVGFPIWNKSLVYKLPTSGGRGNSGDSAQFCLLPFVRDSANLVNSLLIFKVTNSDTSFVWQCDWQYGDTTNLGLSKAQTMALLLRSDNEVFGVRGYNVNDSSILGQRVANLKINSIGGVQNNTSGRTEDWIQWIQVCTQGYVPQNGWLTGCAPGTACNPYVLVTLDCVSIPVLMLDGSNGSTTSWTPTTITTNGSGSGATSWTPPNNPCSGPVGGNRGSIYENCTPGWVPILISIQLPPYILNNLTKPCLIQTLNKLSAGTTNTFFKEIYNIFDNSTNFHLAFTEASLSTAYGTAELTTINSDTFVTVTMDISELLSCSKEWMAYVMIHEVAHAAMFTNIISWDANNSQHIAMAGEFLSKMVNTLRVAYPTLSEFNAYAICFTGFFNGIEGNPTPSDLAFSHLIALEINRKFNVALSNAQIAAMGDQFTEHGTAGTRGLCN